MSVAPPTWSGEDAGRFVDHLLEWFAVAGAHRYDECVSQTEHALQCAWLATRARADDAAVAAALLHDVGHLIGRDGEAEPPDDDLEHEAVGARWLEQCFPREVTAPILGHVAAKRYLCAVEPEYFARLSPGSVRSLALQGGPLSPHEVAAARADPALPAAVALRRRDDAAKVRGREVPPLTAYRELLIGQLRD